MSTRTEPAAATKPDQGKVERLPERVAHPALTFDDVLLVPARSGVLPSEVDTTTRLTPSITLRIPVIAAAMDTVCESALAIALAREGGLGVVHKNLSPAEQAAEVDKVKRSESGMIVDPITLGPDATVHDALHMMERYKISGVPITEAGRLVGILTNRDLRFVEDTNRRVSEVMTKDRLITVPVGTTLNEARQILQENRIEKLLVVDDDFQLKGLITFKDIQKQIQYPAACKDEFGRLRVAAAVGVGGELAERAEALVRAGVDLLVVDSAHGHSNNVMAATRELRSTYPALELVVGNVATAEGARDLIEAGAQVVKVGIGPGSTCTTRVVSGVGVPQISAILDVVPVAEAAGATVIADGGVKYSGDLTKAIAAGAHVVMVGNLFAGTEESPGETILYEGRSYKIYRGMGSVAAMRAGSSDRYAQSHVDDAHKLVAEGIEGRVPYRGPVGAVVYQLIGGLRAGMGYCGVSTIAALRQETRFVQVTGAGLREAHPHDVAITREAPNYQAK